MPSRFLSNTKRGLTNTTAQTDPFAFNSSFYSRDVDGGSNYDMEGALNSQGLFELKDPGLDWFRQTGQGNFANPTDYFKWVYGGGSTVSGPNGQQYFQTPNGLGNVVNQPLDYNEQEFADSAWMIPLGIAGAGLLAGGLGAGAGAGGELAAGTGGAFDMGGLAGGVEGAGGATGWTTGSGFGDILGGATGGTTGGSGLSLGDLTNIPTGGGGDMFDFGNTGSGYDTAYGGGMSNGTYEGADELVKSGGFDWGKFFSGSGSGWLNLLGAGAGALSSWLASNAQVKSAEEANQLLWAMYQQNRADAGPYREAGYGALANMVNMTTPGEKFTAMQADPGYRWRLGQGEQAANRALAARGMFGSGRALKELTRYGQGFASNEFGNIFNRNASLAGLGQTAVTNTGNQGAATAGAMGNNITGAGNATASGYVGVGNALSGGVQNYLNNANQQALMNALLYRSA